MIDDGGSGDLTGEWIASAEMFGKDFEGFDISIVPAFHVEYHSKLLIKCPSIATALKDNSVNEVLHARIVTFQLSKQTQQSQAEHTIYKYTQSQQAATTAICIHSMQCNIAYMYTSSALLALFTFCIPDLLHANKEAKESRSSIK